MSKTEEGVSVWNSIMSKAMKMPFVKVDRSVFLYSKFKPYCNHESLTRIIDTCPAMVVDNQIIRKVASDCISKSTRNVTLLSIAAGIPGAWAMLGTIPGDLAQFYAHVFRIAQELAYIYGYPDLTDERGRLSDESLNTLTLFVGVMLGAAAANEALDFMAKGLSKQIVKKLPKMALTKTAIYPIVKKVGTWIGLKVTRESFAKGLSKAVPFLGGIISGSLTYASFKPMANRLDEQLNKEMPLLCLRFKN